jgi:hypothetical protein
MIIPLDGITVINAVDDRSRDPLFKPVGYFRRCPPLFQCVIPPENFPGTVEEYKALCWEFETEYGKYKQDYSCGKAIRLPMTGMEALDALQRVYDAWVVPKLTSMGLDPLDPYH